MEALFCGRLTEQYIGAYGYPHVASATLNGRTFLAWVSYGDHLPPSLKLSSRDLWPVGFKLDGGKLFGIDTDGRDPKQSATLKFVVPDLSVGPHMLTIGWVNPSGSLSDELQYCFHVPNNMHWER
jgi:hypothetical protein